MLVITKIAKKNDMLKQYENHCGDFKICLALFILVFRIAQ